MELGFDWDEPMPEEHWSRERSTAITMSYPRRGCSSTFTRIGSARQVLNKVAGLHRITRLTPLTAESFSAGEASPAGLHGLGEMFPGYKYEYGQVHVQGRGGSVKEVTSMLSLIFFVMLLFWMLHHCVPTSIEQLNLFGEYTSRFSEIKMARIAVKRWRYGIRC